jgi:hypothetical protein
LQKYFTAMLLVIIIINIKDWTLWSVPAPELQLLSPTFLRPSNCSPSLWSVVIWFPGGKIEKNEMGRACGAYGGG